MVKFCHLLLFSVCLANSSVHSQDNLQVVIVDTIITDSTGESQPKLTRKFPFRSVIAAGLITYGSFAVHNTELQDINASTLAAVGKPEHNGILWIDNFTPAFPLLAMYGFKTAGVKGEHPINETLIINGIAFLISNAVVETVKSYHLSWRPDSSNQRSFPSGHTANAFMSAEMLRKEFSGVSPWYGVAGYTFAAATGYLRMYNRKHWLSDVAAGAGVGILSTQLAYLIYPPLKRLLKPVFKGDNAVVLPFYNHGVMGLHILVTLQKRELKLKVKSQK